MPVPAVDDHGRRHRAEGGDAVEVARQDVHQSFPPQFQIWREHIERGDGHEVGVERGVGLEAGVEHAREDGRQCGCDGGPSPDPKRWS